MTPGAAALPGSSDGSTTPRRRAIASLVWPAAIWLAVTAATLAARPPMMSTDLPLHAAAWWSWIGQTDIAYLAEGGTDWPPLLTWIVALGWKLFGVSEIWPRLASALAGLTCLGLVLALARQLWPDDPDARRFSAIVLAGSGGFVTYLGTASTVWLLMPLVMAALLGIVLSCRGREAPGWTMFAIALGLGELSAGAEAFWHMAPLAALMPLLWSSASGNRRHYWIGAAAATLLGLAAALAVAAIHHVPAGGLSVLAARLFVPVHAFGMASQSWGWNLILLPLILFPWLLWTSLWWAAGRGRRQFASPEVRLCLMAAGVALLVALATGNQAIDLLPALPPLCLIIARIWAGHARKAKDFHAALPGLLALFVCLFFFMLNIIPVAHLDAVWRRLFGLDLPIWLGGISLISGMVLLAGSYLLVLLTPRARFARLVQLALLPVLLTLTVNLEFEVTLRPFFDLQPIAQEIGDLQRSGRPIAIFPHYGGEFDLSGRLTQPPDVLADLPAALDWAATHRDGAILSYFLGGILHLPAEPLFLGNAEDLRAALWNSETVAASGGAVLQPRF